MSIPTKITRTAGPGRVTNIVFWIVQVLLVLVFLSAGVAKLAGAAEMVKNFEELGFGQWFRYLTGALEVVAAVLLLLPRLSAFGAILLIPIMIGAVLVHVFVSKDSPGLPLFLLLVLIALSLGRRYQVAPALGLAPRAA